MGRALTESFISGGFLTMYPSHLSESLLLDRLRYIVMLSFTYRYQPSFSSSSPQSATALANSTAIQELFKRTLTGVRTIRSGFRLIWCRFVTIVLSYVQKRCIPALVRKRCQRPIEHNIDWCLQGTLEKAWTLWSSQRPRVTYKTSCKFFKKTIQREALLISASHITVPNINK